MTPITDGEPLALYEQVLDPTHPGTLEGLRQTARQTHLHFILVGPNQKLLDVFEFENKFGLEKLVPVCEAACKEYAGMDFDTATKEYHLGYDLMKVFHMCGHGAGPGAAEQATARAQPTQSASLPDDGGTGSAIVPDQDTLVRRMVLTWERVASAAEAAFSVWESGRDLAWAKEVWERTVAAGRADYSNEIERHRVALLFLGLVGLHRDFCYMAWDESDDPTYSVWAQELDLESFVLGQILGTDVRIEPDEALNHLVNQARPQVVSLLTELLGGTSSVFLSLWKSGPDSALVGNGDDDGDNDLTDYEIMNDNITPEKCRAFDWLESGAEVVLDRF